MVAGAQTADLLADLAAEIDAAIADGEGLDTFRRRFKEVVARNGWRRFTGSESEPGIAWRTQIIYQTNLATSYAAGRWDQLQDMPIWVYRHGGSADPRPQHLAWNGLTLPKDDPFWSTHYPPNGFGCSCYVVGALSSASASVVGGNPRLSPPPPGDTTGIDAGWDRAPGDSVRQTARALAAKMRTWPREIRDGFVRALPKRVRERFGGVR